MQFPVYAWAGAALLSGALSSSQPVTLESGNLLLYLAGKQVGHESYVHQREGDMDIWSGSIDLQTDGMTLRQRPRLVLAQDGHPVSFDLDYSTGGPDKSMSYVFGEESVTVTSKDGQKESSDRYPLPPGAVVLSNNVLHHEIILARRYDWKKGGRQVFTAVPNTRILLESRDPDDFLLNGTPIVLRHLFLSIGGVIGANLWLDSQGRLVKADMPLQRITVFLEGYEKMEPALKTVAAGRPAFESIDVTFPSDDVLLSGTLTIPKTGGGPCPGVILVSDTGPQNRDGDSPGVGGIKKGIFRIIAEKLSNNGIAVLRYDDRGVGKSGGSFPTADLADLERDARSAITCLRGRAEVNPARIGIVGLTEGAILGARIASDSPDIRALVSMACPARNGEEVMRWQQQESLARLGLNEEGHRSEAKKGDAFIDAIKRADGDVVEVDGQRINVRWFHDFFAVDPLQIMKRVKCSVALMQGGKDSQVPPEDAATLDKALTESDNRDHELKIFPNLGHLFAESSGEGMAELADTQRPISGEALDYLLNFLKRKL